MPILLMRSSSALVLIMDLNVALATITGYQDTHVVFSYRCRDWGQLEGGSGSCGGAQERRWWCS